MEIEGYKHCRCGCGRLVLDHVAHLTGGAAFECWLEGRPRQLKEIQLKTASGRVSIPVPKRRERKNKGNPETRRKVEHARTRAMRRLRHLYPDVFEVLYAEERHRAGLLPVPQRKPLEESIETYWRVDA